MKTYKAPDNSLHCIEPEFAHLLPEGCVQISDEEAEEIRAANQPQPDPKAEAHAYLNSTDWMVVRFAEVGTPIPEEVKAKRAECRALLP